MMVWRNHRQYYSIPQHFKSCYWNRFLLQIVLELTANNDDGFVHNRRGCSQINEDLGNNRH